MKRSQIQGRDTHSTQLLLGTVLVGTLIAVLIEVIVQGLPPHYSPVSQPESDLAVGPYGFLEAISFFMRGALTLVFIAVAE